MNTPFDATLSSQFNFFDASKNNGGFSSIKKRSIKQNVRHNEGKIKGFKGNKNPSQKQTKNEPFDGSPSNEGYKNDKNGEKQGRNMKLHISKSANAQVGSLIADPGKLGFTHLDHKLRKMPKFLIGQQPQLDAKPFKQDSWDKANQEKMLQLENSIDDVTDLYETLKKMRDIERKIMENKGLVDKADSAKDLTEAICFQGTCLDMCPIFERARRNVEYTVFSYEKDDPSGKKASRWKALKVFARPAAAAAPPLPSDVRPPHILSKTLDYIIDKLLTTLPESEGFIWDRMRSIRQDFTYQNYCGPEAVDCNEKIVRIHLLIIHIMAKSNTEFSLQQELEQLHKSLITLSEIYDEVRANGGSCPNEAEFRAYALLSKIRDPEYDKNIQDLPTRIFQNELVQIALCFRRMISNSSFSSRGYIRTENCLNFYDAFFQAIHSEKVPFLMSCFLELYVNEVRFYGFKALSFSINKKHGRIPNEYFIDDFLFNDKEQFLQFCNYYSMDVNNEGIDLKSLAQSSHKPMEKQPLRQPYLICVDNMLDSASFCDIINNGEPNPISGSGQHVINNAEKIFPASDQNINAENKHEAKKEHEGTKTTKDQPKAEEEENTVPMNNNGFAPVFNGKLPTDIFTNNVLSLNHSNSQLTNKKEVAVFDRSLNSIQQQVPSTPDVFSGKKQAIFAGSSLGPIIHTTINATPTTDHRHKEDRTMVENTEEMGEKSGAAGILQVEGREQVETPRVNSERKLREQKAVQNVSEELLKGLVHQETSKLLNEALEDSRKSEILTLTNDLYYAFLHEKIYTVYQDSVAEVHYERMLKKKFFNKLQTYYQSQIQKKKLEHKRKAEFKNVGRQLGAPVMKRSKMTSTPKNDRVASFLLPSSLRKDITLSPVFDEANAFLSQAEKRMEAWEPLNIRKTYFEPLSEKSRTCGELCKNADVFLYGNNWSTIPNSWLMNKFGLKAPMELNNLQDEHLSMNIRCIDLNYDPATFSNLQLLIFNTGVTASNIFDLEMKLQQDGEELIKLVTGISLNTNLNFTLVILYWESAETPLSDNVIFKCLKINRITKGFCSILQNVNIITISNMSPHEELQRGLKEVAHRYHFALTERGKYHASLNHRRTLAGFRAQSNTAQAIDEKMRRMLELEQKKYNKEEDQRNTYAHLKSHIAASPRLQKKKLPVLLSKSKEFKFKTPLAMRSISSSSASAIPSHLAAKRKGEPRIPSYHGILPSGTPSHSTNLPVLPISNSCLLNTNGPDNSQMTNSSFEHPSVIYEPALYQTPINSSTHPFTLPTKILSNPSASSSAQEQCEEKVTDNVQELKQLIESVKKKVNNE